MLRAFPALRERLENAAVGGILSAVAALLQGFEFGFQRLKFPDSLLEQFDMRSQQTVGFSATFAGVVLEPKEFADLIERQGK